ncbi:MAM and LDL-receptor class A domain-containing protein 1-like [Ostrea edulis]|uniref:MAM and LDL-receptor class A domain-containing protein 1-like n=1 Tax=Ostrea edulis TaxID=37623 RepID=UPI0024AECEC2|nr:MAM and LDL-receptor class A domain-containing protein 1-like [Ostrea edulis]
MYLNMVYDGCIGSLSIFSLILLTKGSIYKSCDFEFGFCDWTYQGWTRVGFKSPLENTGPEKAISGQYYIYSHGRETGHNTTATLETSDVTGQTTKCLLFNYHMRGLHIEKLQVKWKSTLSEIWTRENQQGDEWNCAAINVSTSKTDRLLFIASTGRTSTALYDIIGIDNIKIVSPTGRFCIDTGCNISLDFTSTTPSLESTPSFSSTVPVAFKISTETETPWFETNLPYLIGIPTAIVLVSSIVIGIYIFRTHHKRRSAPSLPNITTPFRTGQMISRYQNDPTHGNSTTQEPEYVYPDDEEHYETYLDIVHDSNVYLDVVSDDQNSILQNRQHSTDVSVIHTYKNIENDYEEPVKPVT